MADHNCEMLLCLKDKTGALEQLSTSPAEMSLDTLKSGAKSQPITDDSIRQFVIALTNDMRLSSAASTKDSKRDSDEL